MVAILTYGIYQFLIRLRESNYNIKKTILGERINPKTTDDPDEIIEPSEAKFATDRAENVVKSRECCKMHGRLGDSMCNICGRVIPIDWVLEK